VQRDAVSWVPHLAQRALHLLRCATAAAASAAAAAPCPFSSGAGAGASVGATDEKVPEHGPLVIHLASALHMYCTKCNSPMAGAASRI